MRDQLVDTSSLAHDEELLPEKKSECTHWVFLGILELAARRGRATESWITPRSRPSWSPKWVTDNQKVV